MHQFIVDLPLLVVRLLTLSFFSIGFMQYFARVWACVFADGSEATVNWRRRAYLLALAVGLGVLIHTVVMLTPHSQYIIIYHNLALFVLITPLLFDGFSRWEVGLQSLAILFLWGTHHWLNFWRPATLACMVGFALMLTVMHRHGTLFLRHWAIGVASAAINGALFWFSTPAFSAGTPMTWALRVESVVLYGMMLVLVLGYWTGQQRREDADAALRELAYHERGTAAAYAAHQKDLVALFTQAHADRQPLTFVVMDIDHFRQVNEHYGHLAGNAVLIGIADALQHQLESAGRTHQLYATTGEEFSLVFPGQTPAQVQPLIHDLWQTVRKGEFTYEARAIAVTVSVGVTAQRPDDASINDLYKRADDSLSLAKRSGRDGIAVEGELLAGADHTTRRLDDYRFFAQGVYELTDGRPLRRSNELLLRTYDAAQQRWVLPDSFELPAWMQIALLKAFMSRTGIKTFNINLTAAQFEDVAFAEAITQFVESQVGPDHLNVEITNLTDSQTTRRISALYRAAGVKIMIDDVGSDNSFELVQSALPYVNNVKFAMQNLRKQASAEELQQRVAFWVRVAAANRLTFVLEGVENDADVALARRMGILYVQGYHFDKPSLTVDEATHPVTF